MANEIIVHFINVFVGPNALGNTAGVVELKRDFPDRAMMARIARNVKTPVAFIAPKLGPEAPLRIRVFYPMGNEVAFCGHSILAAAQLISRFGQQDSFHFQTGDSHIVHVLNNGTWFVMSRGSDANNWQSETDARAAARQKGYLNPSFYRSIALFKDPKSTAKILFVEQGSYRSVQTANLQGLGLGLSLANGLVVYCAGDVPANLSDAHIVFRYFWSGQHDNEDPASGVAALLLAELLKPTGEMMLYQASEAGGYMKVRYNTEAQRAVVRGRCKVLDKARTFDLRETA